MKTKFLPFGENSDMMYHIRKKGEGIYDFFGDRKLSQRHCLGSLDADPAGVNKKSLATTYFPAKSSIIGARELDFRVRNGNGYYLSAMVTRH